MANLHASSGIKVPSYNIKLVHVVRERLVDGCFVNGVPSSEC